jgi:hypothetical protein
MTLPHRGRLLGDDGDTLVAAAFNAFLKHIVIQAFVVDCPIFLFTPPHFSCMIDAD